MIRLECDYACGAAENVLPAISRNIIGSVSGQVVNQKGDAMSGVEVVISSSGEAIAKVETDKQGQWKLETLTYGEYTAAYTDDKYVIPAAGFTVDDANVNVALSAVAVPPAKITVRAFIDENNNGAWGRGEGYLKDVEVSLVDENGAVVATEVTGKDCYATLAAPEGNYRLRVNAPADYGFGKIGGKLDTTESVMDESASRVQESGYIALTTNAKAEAGIGMMPMAISPLRKRLKKSKIRGRLYLV